MLDTTPGVAKFVLRRETVRRYENCSLKNAHNTRWYKYILQGSNSGEGEILEAWCYTRASGAASILNGEPSDSREFQVVVVKWLILESWCYTRRRGQRRSLAESRPIPGNSRWCSAWLNPREDGCASCPTPVGSKRKWCYLKSFVYTRAAWRSAYTRSNQDSVYTRSLPRFCLYQVVFQDSIPGHTQRPWGGERLGGRYTPVERLRRRLRDCLREARLLGDDARWGRLVSPISTDCRRLGLTILRQQLLVGRLLSRPLCLGVGRAATEGIQLQASLL